MRALIGLGNPGWRYQMTRHNAGFLFLDYLNSTSNIPFSPGKGDYYFYENADFLMVKPTTYMNRSGRAVKQVMDDYSLSIGKILIVYDDFNLPFGTIRFRAKGSDGGHNGIKSVVEELGTEEFNRLKIGIGHPGENTVEYVLSEFSKTEMRAMETVFELAEKGIHVWREKGIDHAMSQYNRQVFDLSEGL